MAEAISGRTHLFGLILTGGLIPFRGMREVGDVRKARQKLQKLLTSDVKLKIYEKKGQMMDYVKEHDRELEYATESVKYLYDVLRIIIYDIHTIKSVIRSRYKEDERLKGKMIPKNIGNELEHGIEHTRQQVNNMLRETSDMLGAETGR